MAFHAERPHVSLGAIRFTGGLYSALASMLRVHLGRPGAAHFSRLGAVHEAISPLAFCRPRSSRMFTFEHF
jgi:hypothetical protein